MPRMHARDPDVIVQPPLVNVPIAPTPTTKGDSPALPPLQVTRPRSEVGRLRPPEFARHAIEQALISNEGIHAVQHAHDLTKVL